jgi:hypothetical protein
MEFVHIFQCIFQRFRCALDGPFFLAEVRPFPKIIKARVREGFLQSPPFFFLHAN